MFVTEHTDTAGLAIDAVTVAVAVVVAVGEEEEEEKAEEGRMLLLV